MRLDRFVSKSTELTRADARLRISKGEVRVNGLVVLNEASQVHENNSICLNGQKLKTRPFRYILLHKPAGTICSNIDEAYPSLFNYLNVEKIDELHTVGRLDADTTGMVLITDDGRWTYQITHPSLKCNKVYRVGLSSPIAAEVAEQFQCGIFLQGEDKPTLPAQLIIIEPKLVLLHLAEGKFHQVKRMFSAVGNRVVSLHREQIGELKLDLAVGEWRYLSADEVKAFLS